MQLATSVADSDGYVGGSDHTTLYLSIDWCKKKWKQKNFNYLPIPSVPTSVTQAPKIDNQPFVGCFSTANSTEIR